MNLNAAIESLIAKVRTKHLSYQTEKTYAHWLRRYILFVRTAPAADSRRKVEMFLTHLARQDVAASTQNQAFQDLIFFYKHVLGQELSDVDALRAKRPARIRHAPAREDVLRLLAQVKDRGGYPVRLIVHLLYGCGLRVNEPLNLRIKDVDIAGSRLFIRDAKGGKDRVVAMPCALVEPIRAQLAVADGRWQLDRQNGIPVPLPGRLDKKSPGLAHSRSWYWLFPAHSPCRHPRTGQTVRYRCLENNIQRAVKEAARRIGLDGSITPHHLRHAYATHLLEGGVSPRAIQAAMGHVSLETTMGYLHADSTSVPSPLPAGGLTACYNQKR